MSQTRAMSAVESVANVAIGYGVAVASQVAIFPLFGVYLPLADNLLIGAWFTVISLPDPAMYPEHSPPVMKLDRLENCLSPVVGRSMLSRRVRSAA